MKCWKLWYAPDIISYKEFLREKLTKIYDGRGTVRKNFIREVSKKQKSLISVTKCDDPSDYESDEYNDSDYNYNPGNLSAKNETLLEEIIIIGNVSYSLDDLPTYNVTINLNLPEIKPLKETVLKYFTDRTIHGRLLSTDGQ